MLIFIGAGHTKPDKMDQALAAALQVDISRTRQFSHQPFTTEQCALPASHLFDDSIPQN